MRRRPARVFAIVAVLLLRDPAALFAEPRGAEPRGDRGANQGEGAAFLESSSSASFLSRHRKSLLVGSGSGAAAAGLAAILYRRAANDRFEDYLRAAEPERLATLYEETAALDNRAAAFFITAEALFVVALYLGFFVEPARQVSSTAAALDAPRQVSDEPSRVHPTVRFLPQRGLALSLRF